MVARLRRVIWSPLALAQIEAIAATIAAERPAAALRWVDGLFEHAARLRQFPELGVTVPELGRQEIRELPHPPCRLVYRVDLKHIVVLTVQHGRQERDFHGIEGIDAP